VNRRSRREHGFTLLEALVALSIMMVVMGALVALFGNTLQSYTAQRQLTNAAQNVEIASAMLQYDLKTAGFPGGTDEANMNAYNAYSAGTSSSTAYSSDSIQAYTQAASNWPFTGPVNWPSTGASATDDTVTISPSGSSCSIFCDTLSVVRVVQPLTGQAADTYRLERVDYTATPDANGLYSLTRNNTFYNCPIPAIVGVPTGTRLSLASTSACASTTVTPPAPQPAVEGVEEFQVFVQYKNGTFSKDITLTPRLDPTSPVAKLSSNSVSSVFVYLRLRAPKMDTRVTDTKSYPSAAVTLPTGYTASTLGIPTVTYSGTDRNYRRVEKLVAVSFLNKQVTPL